MELDAIMNKVSVDRPQIISPVPKKKNKSGHCKSKKNSIGLEGLVGKYNLIAELASAARGMNFRKLIR